MQCIRGWQRHPLPTSILARGLIATPLCMKKGVCNEKSLL